MCGGVEFEVQGIPVKVYFPNPEAKLPVKTKSGDLQMVPWGRRKEQVSKLPMGGWARLDSIENGTWEKYAPIPVKIKISRFMEKDKHRTSHWFELKTQEFLQGLLVQNKDEQRVYVVTVDSASDNSIHDRWPRIINENLNNEK